MGRNARGDQRTAPHQPGLPGLLWWVPQRNRLNGATQPFQAAQALATHVQNARLHGQVTRQITQPAHACALNIKIVKTSRIIYIVRY